MVRGLSIDDTVWNHSTFSKNRGRLLEHAVVPELFAEVVRLAEQRGLLSKDHFSVDGTLIQAWASLKSFRPKDDDPGSIGRNQAHDFHGEQRKNDTHASATDPDARLYRKSANMAAILCCQDHTVVENRHGLVVRAQVSHVTGTAERDAALGLLQSLPGKRRKTVGADKGYDVKSFVQVAVSGASPPMWRRKTKAARSTSAPWTYRLRRQSTQAQTRGRAVRLGFGPPYGGACPPQ